MITTYVVSRGCPIARIHRHRDRAVHPRLDQHRHHVEHLHQDPHPHRAGHLHQDRRQHPERDHRRAQAQLTAQQRLSAQDQHPL